MIGDKVNKWLIKAFEDFKTVEHELTFPNKEIVTSSVCFHCQQFVEKLLKAYLTAKNIDFKRTHNLDFLLKLCAEQDKEFKKIKIGDLTSYAIEIRYPDEFYIPTLREARESYKISLKVKDFILRKLKIKEDMYIK
ncbi:MAG: HEPN domain-containing protein [Candidatus Goldbacteria bacterium]|nr:HEPN domain-containing protein [Candidatus Goldiibacteriota bacterium]